MFIYYKHLFRYVHHNPLIYTCAQNLLLEKERQERVCKLINWRVKSFNLLQLYVFYLLILISKQIVQISFCEFLKKWISVKNPLLDIYNVNHFSSSTVNYPCVPGRFNKYVSLFVLYKSTYIEVQSVSKVSYVFYHSWTLSCGIFVHHFFWQIKYACLHTCLCIHIFNNFF